MQLLQSVGDGRKLRALAVIQLDHQLGHQIRH